MGDSVDERKRTTLRRFAALGATTPFVGVASGTSGDDSRSEVPDAIRGYLSTTPGAHFSKLRDDLKLGTGETQHHLRALVDAGEIDSRVTASTVGFSRPSGSASSNRLHLAISGVKRRERC